MGLQISREPAGIADTDFNGSGGPGENGRTETRNVPRIALPVQLSGTVAATSGAASRSVNTIRITLVRRARVEKS